MASEASQKILLINIHEGVVLRCKINTIHVSKVTNFCGYVLMFAISANLHKNAKFYTRINLTYMHVLIEVRE